MSYTLTVVGHSDTSTPDAMAQAEEDVEAKARSAIASLPGVSHARAEFASGKIVDLLAGAEPEQPAEPVEGSESVV